jgi:hypothetical protein
MERTKIENQIQEKLNSREIQPSAQAWDRLDAMLTVAEEKKTKRSPFLYFRYIGIAASFLILLVIGNYFYNEVQDHNSQKPNKKTQPIIATSNPEVSEEIPKEENLNQNPIQVVQNEKQLLTHNSQPITHNPQTKRVSIINQNQSNPVAEVIQKQQEIPQPFIPQEILVSNQKNDVVEVEIPIKKEISVAKIKVNATSLLSQVDGELEQSYRETKFEKIARNFNTVKVALANRNNK